MRSVTNCQRTPLPAILRTGLPCVMTRRTARRTRTGIRSHHRGSAASVITPHPILGHWAPAPFPAFDLHCAFAIRSLPVASELPLYMPHLFRQATRLCARLPVGRSPVLGRQTAMPPPIGRRQCLASWLTDRLSLPQRRTPSPALAQRTTN